MEFEFDERTLYGEDQISSLGNVPREVCDDMDSAADSDNDESTEIDIGMSSRGSCGQSSLEGHSFAPIPENEVISEAHVSAAQAIHVRARVKPEDDSAEQLNGVKMGTSAPIRIPTLKKSEGTTVKPKQAVEPERVTASFVPPHLIGSMDTAAFGFGWDGASPAAVLKKDKLRTRNAILRSTGFLADHQDFLAAQLSTVAGGNISSHRQQRVSSPPVPAQGALKAAMDAQK
uniref:Uncharacterized protein n=1 Tax=Tetraselmis sp. GSL018 TaxID=582737 RepID=A0A061S124_9CHLO|eukprot:CAMPEP_0177601232 /NCGR_PEP_ID=MMETSP0419_2-20121207/14128_1 /TAXON_ID=582737 /ORGANISM="Tetraselmis sp., Strain GSL018" /LENGTH=230 /DNA_ID=CAMNT_0019094441 /DNA_START=260 /DNA_END=952 /DNA_ORIENTATION=-